VADWKRIAKIAATGGLSLLFEARAQSKLAKSGTPARATCTAFSQQWDDDEGTPMWGGSTMTLQVRPPTGEPYEWSGSMWVRVARYNEIPGDIEGRDLPVRVDPSDPQRVAVDWDAAAQEARGISAGISTP
jgi:hypothetical protein